MAVQLPDDLMIAYAGAIEIGNAPEVACSGFDSARIIASPGDFVSGGHGAGKERKFMGENQTGQTEDVLRIRGTETPHRLLRMRQASREEPADQA